MFKKLSITVVVAPLPFLLLLLHFHQALVNSSCTNPTVGAICKGGLARMDMTTTRIPATSIQTESPPHGEVKRVSGHTTLRDKY